MGFGSSRATGIARAPGGALASNGAERTDFEITLTVYFSRGN